MNNNKSAKKYKAQYPYLVHWKQQGFDNFPEVPADVFLEAEKKEPETLAAALGGGILSDIALREQHQRKIDEYHRRKGNENAELRAELDRGSTRSELMKKWANNNLPITRGGSAIPDERRLLIIKQIYHELMDCIKDVRKALDVPLMETKDDVWPMPAETIEDVKVMVPNAASIFDEKDFLLLFEHPSVKKAALEILHKRLKRSVYNPFTIRTLQDIIYKTNL
jgi:hypothetical protein